MTTPSRRYLVFAKAPPAFLEFNTSFTIDLEAILEYQGIQARDVYFDASVRLYLTHNNGVEITGYNALTYNGIDAPSFTLNVLEGRRKGISLKIQSTTDTPNNGLLALVAEWIPLPGNVVAAYSVVGRACGKATFVFTLGVAPPGPPGGTTLLPFTTQPTLTINTGDSIGTPVVTVRDALGATVTSFTGDITLRAVYWNTYLPIPGGFLVGTLTRAAIAGVATFPGLTYTHNGIVVLEARISSVTTLPDGTTARGYSEFIVVTDLVPPPDPQPPTTLLKFTTQPTASLTTGGSIGTPVVTVWNELGLTVTTFTGTITLQAVEHSSFAAHPAAYLVGTKTVTAVAGVATFAGLTYGHADVFLLEARISSVTTLPDGSTARGYSRAVTVQDPAPTPTTVLKFTTQPTANIAVDGSLGTPVVTVRDELGATVTAFTGTITLQAVKPSAHNAITPVFLLGTLAQPAVAGVATFAGLTYSHNGVFVLEARISSVTTLPDGSTARGYSDMVTVTGTSLPDFFDGRRQSYLTDRTVVKKTTNITAPTIVSASADEMKRIDGDTAVTDKVTTDGFRFLFPYLLGLAKLHLKFALSTLVGGPLIRMYYSTDTTTGSNGTWTQFDSFIPAHSQTFWLRSFIFNPPQRMKGLWVTLDDGGGAATCDWYSIQIVGLYQGAPLTLIDGVTYRQIIDEETCSIPYPPENLEGARTVTRVLGLQNADIDTHIIEVLPLAARYGGDLLMDTDNLFLLDSAGAAVPGALTVTLGAGETYFFTSQYTITAAQNVLDGLHLARFRLRVPYTARGNWFIADASVNDCQERTLLLGTLANTYTLGAVAAANCCAVDSDERELYVCQAANFNTARVDVFDLGEPTVIKRTLTLASAFGDVISSMDCWRGTLYFSSTANSGRIMMVQGSDGTILGYGAQSAAAATEAKRMVVGQDGDLWVWTGSGNARVVDQFSSDGTLLRTLNVQAATAFNGLSAAGLWYDRWADHVVITSAASGGFVKVVRYDTAGIRISTTSVAQQHSGTMTAGFIDVRTPAYEYVVWDGRYMWRYDRATYLNGAELYDTAQAHTAPILARWSY